MAAVLERALSWESDFNNAGRFRPLRMTLALEKAGMLYTENSCDCLNDRGLRAADELKEKGMGKRTKEFSQVCVWEATLVGEGEKVDEFIEFISETFGVRAVYLEEVVTGPGAGGDGGRNDVFFAIHSEDVDKFAVPRMAYGIRWVEDVFDNHRERGSEHIYPDCMGLREQYYGPFPEPETKSATGPWGIGAVPNFS